MDALWRRSAVELAAAMRTREVSAREVLGAHLARIAETNPAINAIVTLEPERALAQAGAADEAMARGEPVGPLHGLPIAHKDLADTAGVRTTYGSPIYADHVPERDEPFVVRVREAGAVMLGKTNTPEFGAGSHTFNPVFGPTRNPHDLSKSAAAPRAGRPRRWPAGWCRSPTAAISAGRCGTPRASAAWSDSGPRSGSFPPGPRPIRRICPWTGRWRAPWRTRPCSCR